MKIAEKIKEFRLFGRQISLIGKWPDVQYGTPSSIFISYKIFNDFFFGLLKYVVLKKCSKNGVNLLLDASNPKILMGESELLRQHIVLLYLPQFEAFKRLSMEWIFSKYLSNLSKSVFPISGGYFKRLDSGRSEFSRRELNNKNLCYLIHLFERNKPGDMEFENMLANREIIVHFSGQLIAFFGSNYEGKIKTLPCPMSRMYVLVGFDTVELEKLIYEDFYQSFIESNDENTIGLFENKIGL